MESALGATAKTPVKIHHQGGTTPWLSILLYTEVQKIFPKYSQNRERLAPCLVLKINSFFPYQHRLRFIFHTNPTMASCRYDLISMRYDLISITKLTYGTEEVDTPWCECKYARNWVVSGQLSFPVLFRLTL